MRDPRPGGAPRSAGDGRQPVATGVVVGYDPGGNGRHGLAILQVRDGAPTGLDALTCATAEAVLREVEVIGTPLALGVDALTCWSTGPGGWRPADRWLMSRYPEARRSVVSPNALYGSMGLSGMAVLLAVRERAPGALVTEAHPKVLYRALWGGPYDYARRAREMDHELGRAFGVAVSTATDHEWDAAASALAALRALDGSWTRDLHRLPTAGGERTVAPAGPTRYAWPDS